MVGRVMAEWILDGEPSYIATERAGGFTSLLVNGKADGSALDHAEGKQDQLGHDIPPR